MTAVDPDTSRSTPAVDLRVRDLGRMPYTEALTLQRSLLEQVIADRQQRCAGKPVAMHLLLVEHDPPVITVSRRKTARQHLVATPQQLRAAGVEVAETDRGGDITYHGPGQLVVYPILDLNVLGLRLREYMRFLEQLVIDLLARHGIDGQRDESATGVWVAPQSDGAATAKICAMGVRISRWVSMHGLALNVTTDLSHFQLIVPCGLAGRPVTSMAALLGEACPSMESMKMQIADQFLRAVNSAATATSTSQ